MPGFTQVSWVLNPAKTQVQPGLNPATNTTGWPKGTFDEKGIFLRKRAPKVSPPSSPSSPPFPPSPSSPPLPPPFSIPFLSVLHQSKALYSFRKKGHRSIVKHNIILEYTLASLVPSLTKKLVRF